MDCKGHRYEKEMILLCVRWYLAHLLSYRNLEETMVERSVAADHTNVHRWVQKFTPLLEARFRRREEASCRFELADGRDVHPDQGSVEILVSRGG